MDDRLRDALNMGFFCGENQNKEVTQFLAMIQRFSENLPRYSDQERVCAQFVRIIIEETEFSNCSILFPDHENKLSLVAAYGLSDEFGASYQSRYNRKLRFRLVEGIAGRVFSSRQSVFIENATVESIPEIEGTAITFGSLVCVPLIHLGVMNVSAFHPQKFSAQSRRNWELLGNIIGHFIAGLKGARGGSENDRPDAVNAEDRVLFAQPAFRSASNLVLDSLPQGICILDTGGKVVLVNRTIDKMNGGRLNITERSPAVIFQDPDVFENLLKNAVDSESGQVDKSGVNLINSAGEIYVADLNLIRLSDEAGMVSGYLLVLEDITRKKALSQKMIQSEKLAALGTMAGGVSHDFNNMLMAILGNIQLILPQIEQEEIRSRLQNIENVVHEGSKTVQRLQMLTERDPEFKAMSYTVDVAEAVKDIVELTRPQWKNFMEKSGCKIEIQTDLEPNCFAAISPSNFRKILTNLLLNTIDAMPQGGTLTFRARSSDEHVILEISDTGIGMTREVAEKIFDPFFTTKGIENSGLGLSVSWSLLRGAGGDIQVKSMPGKGATFVIKLARAEAVKSQPVSISDERNRFSRLLLVDDDPVILNLLRDMLRLKGYKVVAVSDSEQALELIDRGEFDLVLTELAMPVLSGWEIARRTKAKNKNTPVVMMTGRWAQYEGEDLSGKGVDLVLAKPLSWDNLLGAMEMML